ncbi:SDR family NAD(P)-dependent oxidoreductase [Afifella marina]|uniref:3-oxoacyl-[acyl-carrier protein] reductase n=2 Tax=Hyphomicrobiales TaxID=356 RepID=A0A1G5NP82_AFIMA|nr:glucose 1-dehydrogenase [Afifella marina]MBK1624529.1 3-oxoacyl-ACP reductase [Afifella marina DSM 2698]MBK1627422.1 3-oxoacyl-ACP reductase [Afifella marina]MBK5918480.1 2-deoxy-D-gluconate 3-dehydrogenase [Afifella marina]RAI20637.1 2-deoxy-D-gluconate 3-dehydrogenase [Afifella marina DSM 2698]SCZ39223.1 3-oxoacyl-[acyl-carrier protein] reductase [Afifella marina DSM 2698]
MRADELFDLTGQVALVTGASSGLGRRFARVLAANGAKVVLTARRQDKLEELADEIVGAGGAALAVACDVTDEASLTAAFEVAEARFGTVTILVNNAGIAPAGPAISLQREHWRQVMATNLDAAFFVAQAAAERMAKAKTGGAIVNIASVLGFAVSKGTAPYATSKAALVHLTKALALEWARYGIRVNAIAPGWFLTEINREFLESPAGEAIIQQNPMRRFGEEGDLDGALLYLASKASAYVSGTTVTVDGGQVLAGGG